MLPDWVRLPAHSTSSVVGVKASASSRADTTRLNRGYAVRSIDANQHPTSNPTTLTQGL